MQMSYVYIRHQAFSFKLNPLLCMLHKMAVLCNCSVIFLVKKFRLFNFLMQNITM